MTMNRNFQHFTGRRLASLLAAMIGVISFFIPIFVVKQPYGEIQFSGWTAANGIFGFASENYLDIATSLIYGGSPTAGNSSSRPTRHDPDDSQSSSSAGLSGVLAITLTVVAYLALLAVGLNCSFRFSPRFTSIAGGVGFFAALAALLSMFVFIDGVQPSLAGIATQRGLLHIELGRSLYLLLAAFSMLIVVPRMAVLDQILGENDVS